ncbi:MULTISPECIES: glycosyltransferase family 2 protein [Microbacterium]|uniref:glycosyltransferase family 2 protein n=1 Tax=Microbacterium TaxID=33882 RepID=UPI00217D75BD|nr:MULTISPECIES: glycosyltransferase [Microbacterium]UWF77890.1 glycosyltransferase [Microbacterium neungamense]WCM56067.1 glycosyltransferase [Microbacterium sp. EF45047]
MSAPCALSVCVVTYERPAFLVRCLASLAAALGDGHEVIVVDASAHHDGAAAEAAFPGATYLHRPGLAGWMTRSRNEALLHARGDVIAFLDDDVVVAPGWATALLAAYATTPRPDAVAGRTRNLLPGEERYDAPIGRLRDDGTLTAGFAALSDGIVEVDHGIGANMSFRREMLARLGGFRDDYPGTAMREDTDMFLRVKRAGGRTVFVPDAVVDHLPAPHVKGRRFDTRYKLYGRRNHMVMLARHDGLRSPLLRRWIGAELRAIGDAGGVVRRLQRLGVTLLGIAWGAGAAIRQARFGPLPPERSGREADRIRAALGGGSAPSR